MNTVSHNATILEEIKEVLDTQPVDVEKLQELVPTLNPRSMPGAMFDAISEVYHEDLPGSMHVAGDAKDALVAASEERAMPVADDLQEGWGITIHGEHYITRDGDLLCNPMRRITWHQQLTQQPARPTHCLKCAALRPAPQHAPED